MMCRFSTIGAACRCRKCASLAWTAKRLVDRDPPHGPDLRDLCEAIRPFVLKERESRKPTRPGSLGGGNPSGETAISRGDFQYNGGGDGPWHENAVGSMEDGE